MIAVSKVCWRAWVPSAEPRRLWYAACARNGRPAYRVAPRCVHSAAHCSARSASASSKAFNVSSTLPRTTRSRWFLIRSSSIVMTLFSGISAYCLPWRLHSAGLVAFSHLQVSQIRGRQPYSIVRKICTSSHIQSASDCRAHCAGGCRCNRSSKPTGRRGPGRAM